MADELGFAGSKEGLKKQLVEKNKQIDLAISILNSDFNGMQIVNKEMLIDWIKKKILDNHMYYLQNETDGGQLGTIGDYRDGMTWQKLWEDNKEWIAIQVLKGQLQLKNAKQ